MVSKEGILTMLFSENCQEFSKYLNNETLLIKITSLNKEPVNFTIKEVRFKKIDLNLTFNNPSKLSTK